MKNIVLAVVLCLFSLPVWGMQLVTERIVGGVDSKSPPAYLVYLQVEVPGGSQFCGANYIGDGRVLTAAHCLFDGNNQLAINAQMYFNVPGGNIDNIQDADRIDSSVFEIHPGYNNAQFLSDPVRDAGVIFLPEPVPAGVEPVLLATDSLTEDAMQGRKATAYGWGLDGTGDRPAQLQAAVLTVDPEDICVSYGFCSDFILYAGSNDDGRDACLGDSGGPLTIKESNVPFLLGLVSFGRECAVEGEPGGYTRVSAIREWALNIESGRQIVESAVIAKRTTTGEGSISLGFIALLSLIFAYHRRRKQLLVESSC